MSFPSWFCFALLLSIGSEAQAQDCGKLELRMRTDLGDFVRKYFKLPFDIASEASEDMFVAGSCFRRLHFFSVDPQRRFSKYLYLSPDWRFLTRELLDPARDPEAAEREHSRLFAQSLTPPGVPVYGDPQAPLALTIFSDFQCSFCRAEALFLYDELLPSLATDVRVIWRHLPLPIHDWAYEAAEASACVGSLDQKAYWKLNRFLFENQADLNSRNVSHRVREFLQADTKMSYADFQRCLASGVGKRLVDADLRFAAENVIGATPTTFIQGTRIEGVPKLEQIRSIFQQLRHRSGEGPGLQRGEREKHVAESYPQ